MPELVTNPARATVPIPKPVSKPVEIKGQFVYEERDFFGKGKRQCWVYITELKDNEPVNRENSYVYYQGLPTSAAKDYSKVLGWDEGQCPAGVDLFFTVSPK